MTSCSQFEYSCTHCANNGQDSEPRSGDAAFREHPSACPRVAPRPRGRALLPAADRAPDRYRRGGGTARVGVVDIRRSPAAHRPGAPGVLPSQPRGTYLSRVAGPICKDRWSRRCSPQRTRLTRQASCRRLRVWVGGSRRAPAGQRYRLARRRGCGLSGRSGSVGRRSGATRERHQSYRLPSERVPNKASGAAPFPDGGVKGTADVRCWGRR